MGGPEMAPIPPDARAAPAEPWRPSISRSLARVARERRGHAEADVHAARDPALTGQEARARAQPAGPGAGAQRVEAVGHPAQRPQDQAEDQDLRAHGAPRG